MSGCRKVQCCRGSWKQAFCSLPGKTTAGVTYLRALAAVLACFSTVSAMLYICILGLDDVYSVQNSQNVYYSNESLAVASDALGGTANTAESPTLLFPQLRATVGLHTVCVGFNCFLRSRLTGVSALVASAAQGTTGRRLPRELAAAYEEATYQYIFGFDIGAHCGTPWSKTQSLSTFGVAALTLSLVLSLALFAVSMGLCFVVGKTDFLASNTTADGDFHLTNLNALDVPAPYGMRQIDRHLRMKTPLLLSAGILSLFAFFTSVCTMGVAVALNRSKSKCGQSVCGAFKQGMERFYELADSLHVNVSIPRTYSCEPGSSYILVFVTFCSSAVCLTMGSAIFFCYRHSRHHEQMLEMRDQLRRITEVQGLAGGRSVARAESRRGTALANTSSLIVSVSSPSQAYSDMHHSDFFADGGLARRRHFGSPAEDAQRRPRSVGAGIERYRLLKQFMAAEEHSRGCIKATESVHFQVFLALCETVWLAERLCRLHMLTLNCFVGPALEICVLETQCRQQLIREYHAGVTEVLASLREDAGVVPSQPRQPRVKGAVLQEQERAVWDERVRRWQQVRAEMSRSFQRTASHAAAEARLRRRPSSPAHSRTASCAGPNMNEWLEKLEELDATSPYPFQGGLAFSGGDTFAACDAARSNVCTDGVSATGSAEAYDPPYEQQGRLHEGPSERPHKVPQQSDVRDARLECSGSACAKSLRPAVSTSKSNSQVDPINAAGDGVRLQAVSHCTDNASAAAEWHKVFQGASEKEPEKGTILDCKAAAAPLTGPWRKRRDVQNLL
ncbi:putative integral membrane protein [Leishmania donovani]|uniref:Putative integral membrane protein n=1 Tax=Leishmania donovani TaxID=5661 RepID=A0A504X8A9_LEIDO|nr:putative integral membrane protein [Leishmania donovani]